ncbi:MAG TPA: hypothetical protein PLF11_12065 [Bacillota bacterium]|nr:hypothetical protein [Bacillota bacterium]
MFFVVDKPRLQRMIAIVREDRSGPEQGSDSPFLRFAAVGNELTVTSGTGSATFPATVYEEGILFIRTTKFRRILQLTRIKERFATFQVSTDGLRFCDVFFPLAGEEVILFAEPAEAPPAWPPPVDEEEAEQGAGEYLFDERDWNVVAAAKQLLWKIARWPVLNSRRLMAVAKVLNVLEQLPRTGDDIDVSIQLCGPERKYGEHEIRHDWEVRVEGKLIVVTAAGSFYQPGTGHDSFTCLQWTAEPGAETDYCDYLDTCSIVDDVMPFEPEVARINLSEPDYSLEIYGYGEDEDLSDGSEEDDNGFPEEEDESDYIPPCDESERILAGHADFQQGEEREQTCPAPPKTCDLCGRNLGDRTFFVDGRLRNSLMWANMCSGCFLQRGEGLGWGRGQLFARLTDGRWLLVGGWRPDELEEDAGDAEETVW